MNGVPETGSGAEERASAGGATGTPVAEEERLGGAEAAFMAAKVVFLGAMEGAREASELDSEEDQILKVEKGGRTGWRFGDARGGGAKTKKVVEGKWQLLLILVSCPPP